MAISYGRTTTLNNRYKIISNVWSTITAPFAPATSLAVGDSIVFSQTNANGGLYTSVSFTVTTPVVATTFTGVWEYTKKVGGVSTVLTWEPLTGVVDTSNGFTVGGAQSVSWTLPTDWTNWTVVNNVAMYYHWCVRFRITGISGVTDNGSVTSLNVYQPLIDLTGTQTLTMEDIYQANLAGGWGVIDKGELGDYYIKRIIFCNSTGITFSAYDEVFTFGRNAFLHFLAQATISYGGVDSRGNDVGDVTLIYNNYGGDYSGVWIARSNSIIRSVNMFHVYRGGFTSGQGHWGAGIGEHSNQTISSVFVRGIRSFNMNQNTNVVKKLTSYGTDSGVQGQIEPMGCTTIDCKFINTLCFRHATTDNGKWSHRTDGSSVSSLAYRINAYQVASINQSWHHVDFKFPATMLPENLTYWTSGGSSSNWSTHFVRFYSSLIYKIIDESNTPISDAKLAIFDRTGAVVFNGASNQDGYITEWENTFAASSTKSVANLGVASNGTRRFREVFVTSGSNVGQRSVIHIDGTTSLTLAEPVANNPTTGDRMIQIPYVEWSRHNKLTIASGYGNYDYRGTFVVRFRKYGKSEINSSESFYNPIVSNTKLLTDNIITETTEATVAGYASKLTINHTTGTVTLSANVTKAELYDIIKYDLALSANLQYADYFTSTDGINYTCTYDIDLNGFNITGSGTINMPANILTLGGGISTVTINAVNGSTGYLTVTGLSGHSILLLDENDTQLDYDASVTGSYTYFVPNTTTGDWKFVTKKAGYKHQVITFDPTVGGAFTYAVNTPQKLTPEGLPMYVGTSSSLIDITFMGISTAYIEIGDGTAVLQTTLDEAEDALCTNAGLFWLASGLNDVSIFNSFGGDFLFLTSGWRLLRRSAGDSSATIQAYVVSEDGIAVDESNGGVQFLTSDTPEAIAEAVWEALEISHTTAGTMGNALTKAKIKSSLAASLSA